MLTDEINKMKEAGIHLEPAKGGCKYCGQIADMEVPTNWTSDLKDELATEMCDCWEAEEHCEKKKKKEMSEKTIERQFKPLERRGLISETVTEILNRLANMCADEELKTASLDLGKGIKAKVSINGKGNIKIEKKHYRKKFGGNLDAIH